jgi:hypothetical protein
MWAIATAGCLKIDVPDGSLKCSTNPDRRCPAGYYCADDGRCWSGDSQLSTGQLRQLGASCANNLGCDSGHCVDGVCCDSFCLGNCQACNLGGGRCTTIKGAPHGTRQCPSAGFFVCDGTCDGSSPDCTFPGSSTLCGSPVCLSPPPTFKAATFCDGAGHCVPANGGPLTTPCPAPPNATPVCAAAGDQCDFTCNPPYVRQGAGCVLGDM